MSLRRPLALILAALFAQPPAWGQTRGVVLPPNTLPKDPVVRHGAAAVSTPASAFMRIEQSSQQTVIDWSSFNIGSAATVRFYQPSATAEALNRIGSSDPSIIQGSLVANGRVYLVNQNGIVFDRGSRVDVRGLIASALDIPALDPVTKALDPNSVFARGIFGGRLGPLDRPIATLPLDAQGRAVYGSVENYGTIRSIDPDTGASSGGFVMLFAPRVTNNGVIVANNGQVVLAAGEKVFLSADDTYFNTAPQLATAPEPNPFDRPSRLAMRGMLVEVQAGSQPVDLSSMVANTGTVQADRGNATLAALAVNQAGRVSAGSAVSQNGSVFLIARENRFLPGARGGTLTLAPGSVTETPLLSDGTTLAEGQPYWPYRSLVRLEGGTILHQGVLRAPDAVLGIGGGGSEWPATARVLLDAGSVIDVKGSVADVATGKNLFTFRVTSDDLKNAAEQKGGFLLGKTVTVDLRKGNPLLFDLGAAAANVRRTVDEKAATGGDITIRADEVIARPGALVDFSGGQWRYAAGRAATTWLSSGGRQYEISSAPKAVAYDGATSGVVERSHGRWNVTERYVTPFAQLAPYEAAYADGRDAGSLHIDAARLVLDGTLRGHASAGARQIAAAALPNAGRLVLGDATTAATDNPSFRLPSFVVATAEPMLPPGFGIGDALPAAASAEVRLAPSLFETLSAIELYGRGAFTLPEGTRVNGRTGASLTVYAASAQVDGTLRIPSGSVSLNARLGGAQVALGAGGVVSTAGLWINELRDGAGLAPAIVDGGSIALVGHDVTLAPGSLLDVSGGARLAANGKLTAGGAGSIRISATALNSPHSVTDFGALALGGELRGYSAGGKGGILNLTTASVLIGTGPARAAGDLVLDAERFHRGGFASYKVTGYFDIEVAPGTQVNAAVDSWLVNALAAPAQPTGASLSAFSGVGALPPYQQQAAAVTLRSRFEPGADSYRPAPGEPPGGLRIGADAGITTLAGGAIGLESHSAMDVAGALDAPAGRISLALRTDSAGNYGGETLVLASTARLSAAGAFVEKPPAGGRRDGTLLAGGTVSLETAKNHLVLASGSLIDVSGASAVVDLPTAGSALARTTIGSEGGTISIRATENATLGGSFRAAGAGGAAGGTLAIDLLFHGDITPGSPLLADPRHEIVVSVAGSAPSAAAGLRSVTLGAEAVNAAGFDTVRLASEEAIRVTDSASVRVAGAIRLDAPELRIADGAIVSLAAGRVALVNTPGGNRLTPDMPGYVPVPLVAGTGSLAAQASLIELAGHVTLNGAADARLESRGDLRANGFPVSLVTSGSLDGPAQDTQRALAGSFRASGNLELAAQQIYPSSAVTFDIAAPGSRLSIDSMPGTRAAVLSAGGTLRFSAADVVQRGTVLAPLGTLGFAASSSLALGAGSLTSVSAAGAVLPFGETVNGAGLFYGSVDRTQAPPEKRIDLNGASVSIAPAATVDLSGGGALQAVEFVPGIGGTRDVLLGADTWAIVPGLAFAPSEAHYAGKKDLGFGTDASRYDSVVIAAGGPLSAGRYALLPGYYALLPGAYVVQRQSSSAYRDLAAGTRVLLANGQAVISGQLASSASGAREARASGFIVRPGADVLREAEYRVSSGSSVVNPADAGRVSIGSTTAALALGGDIRTLPAAGGRIAQIDIAAPQLAVVARAADAPAGYAALEADRLSALGASLSLGATRSDGVDGTLLDVRASRVRVSSDAAHPLQSSEIVLAARDEVLIAPSASGNAPVLRATGTASVSAADLLVRDGADSGGALVRLSAGAQVALRRDAARGANAGALTIDGAASLQADGSAVLDATGAASGRWNPLVAPGGALTIAASSVAIGAAPAATSGVVIADLGAYGGLGALAIKSYGSLDLFGSLSTGASVGTLTLDAPRFAGFGAAGDEARLQAGTLVLQNTSGATASPAAPGAGRLALQADKLVLGEGDKMLAGFAEARLAARGELRGRGKGSLLSGADLTLEAARIGAESGSQQTVQAKDAAGNWMPVRIRRPANPLELGAAAAGGKLRIDAAWIQDDGAIELPAGDVVLAAHATGGDVVLGAGALVSAAGFAKTFADARIAASAGRIVLSADRGAIESAAGSLVDVSGASGGGAAGELVLAAPQGSLRLDGALRGGAQPGDPQGSVQVDVGSLARFAQLDGKLSLGDFTERRDYRVRSGGVTIPGADEFTLRPGARVAARDFKLVADSGDILVGGVIDASDARGGGRVRLVARGNLVLAAGSLIDARGGAVELESTGGTLAFNPGATIDVSANATGKSDAGSVVFSAPQNLRADGTPGIAMALAGRVNLSAPAGRAAGTVTLEGTKTYAAADTGAASVVDPSNAVWNDFSAFANNAAAIRGDAALKDAAGNPLAADGVRVRGGVELRSAGDLSAGDWNLTGWRSGDVAGRLTLRASGSLNITGALGFADDRLPSGETWSLRLAGGADLASADALAVVPGSGSVTLGSAASKVRTGTGSIAIAAGGDFRLLHPAAVIYTAGAPVAEAPDGTRARFARGGGDISIFAAGDAIGPGNPTWVNDWLRRTTTNSIVGRDGRWWTDRASFRHQIGALGGGDVTIRALGSIDHLSAVIPTSGRATGSGGAQQLFVEGGGDLRVQAGGDIRAGDFLIGRGHAALRAGGVAGGNGRDEEVSFTGGNARLSEGSTLVQDGVTSTITRVMVTSGDPAAGTAAGYLVISGRAGGPYKAAAATSRGGGALTLSGPQTLMGLTLFEMGESADAALRSASIDAQALGNLTIRAAANPTMLPASGPIVNSQPGFGTSGFTFFTYAPSSALKAVSLAGDIVIDNRNDARSALSGAETLSSIFPAAVTIAALGGSVRGAAPRKLNSLDTAWRPFSSDYTSVNVLAAKEVRDLYIQAGDAVGLPDWSTPLQGPMRSSANLDSLLTSPGRTRRVAPSADTRYRVVAETLDVSDSVFEFPQRSRVRAGRDLVNLALELQNLSPADETVVEAGRDVRWAERTSAGEVPGLTGGANAYYVVVSGPGRLSLRAGRSIDFGNSAGVDAIGNLLNAQLPGAASADLALMAGVGENRGAAEVDALFAALKAAGLRQDAAAGDAAMAALFGVPQTGSGSISMVQAGVRTRGGSRIDVLAPHGGVRVGLPSEQSERLGPRPTNEMLQIGLVTGAGGGIRTLVRDDIDVNLSKLMTLLGGDIVVYSEFGNIDAGRGPRDSVSSLAPRVERLLAPNARGALVDTGLRRPTPPISAAGSGIRTISFDPDGPEGPLARPDPGSIYLFAARGFVNAGEAGVSAAGNLVVVAPVVINAQNFSAGGASSGVPVASAALGGAALASSGSATAATSRASEDLARALSSAPTAPAFHPTFITVEVLGFGEGP